MRQRGRYEKAPRGYRGVRLRPFHHRYSIPQDRQGDHTKTIQNDDDGVCPAAWIMCDDDHLAKVLENWINDYPAEAQVPCTSGLAYAGGKATSTPTTADIRLIAPQSSLATILDTYLAHETNVLVGETLPLPPEVFEAARPFTQPLDVSHSVSLLLEKGLDLQGQTAVASADIRQFFDHIDILRALQRLQVRQKRPGLAKAILRHQSNRALRVSLGSSEAQIAPRPIGALTGSRTAMSLGRIPVCDVLNQALPELRKRAMSIGTGPKSVASIYVDNLWTAAAKANDAIRNLEVIEAQLAERWNFHIKVGSEELILPKGHRQAFNERGFAVVQELRVLGHVVAHSGSNRPDLNMCRRKLWQAYWRNCAIPGAKAMSTQARLRLLTRATRPVLSFHAARWAVNPTLLEDIDTVQRRMTRFLLADRPLPGGLSCGDAQEGQQTSPLRKKASGAALYAGVCSPGKHTSRETEMPTAGRRVSCPGGEGSTSCSCACNSQTAAL